MGLWGPAIRLAFSVGRTLGPSLYRAARSAYAEAVADGAAQAAAAGGNAAVRNAVRGQMSTKEAELILEMNLPRISNRVQQALKGARPAPGVPAQQQAHQAEVDSLIKKSIGDAGAFAKSLESKVENMVGSNTPGGSNSVYTGSPYLQERIRAAQKVLLQDLEQRGLLVVDEGAAATATK